MKKGWFFAYFIYCQIFISYTFQVCGRCLVGILVLIIEWLKGNRALRKTEDMKFVQDQIQELILNVTLWDHIEENLA